MRKRVYRIYRTPEFRRWFKEQSEKSKVQIDSRLSRIQEAGHFGDQKFVGNEEKEVWELRWKNGRRLYFAHVMEIDVLLLLGGNKNAQEKDIRKAKSLYKKYTE